MVCCLFRGAHKKSKYFGDCFRAKTYWLFQSSFKSSACCLLVSLPEHLLCALERKTSLANLDCSVDNKTLHIQQVLVCSDSTASSASAACIWVPDVFVTQSPDVFVTQPWAESSLSLSGLRSWRRVVLMWTTIECTGLEGTSRSHLIHCPAVSRDISMH